jgi:hypothetical protein
MWFAHSQQLKPKRQTPNQKQKQITQNLKLKTNQELLPTPNFQTPIQTAPAPSTKRKRQAPSANNLANSQQAPSAK